MTKPVGLDFTSYPPFTHPRTRSLKNLKINAIFDSANKELRCLGPIDQCQMKTCHQRIPLAMRGGRASVEKFFAKSSS